MNDNQIGVVSTKKIMVASRAVKSALADDTGIAENGGPSTEVFVGDLDEKVDSKRGAKAKLSRSSANTRDENAFRDAAAHCVPVE